MTEIRTAGPDDAEPIARAHVLAWQQAYAHVMPDDRLDRIDPAQRTERWRTQLADPELQVWVAVTGTSVVGFASVGPARGQDPPTLLELRGIYTLASVHGSGVAQRLLDAALGRDDAFLWVIEDNPRARAFYLRNGFVPDGVTHVYSMLGVDVPELRMVRRTDAARTPGLSPATRHEPCSQRP